MELGLIVLNDKIVVNSRRVAQNYGKEHNHVLRDIRNIIATVPEAQSNFGQSSYTNAQGREMPEYIMDRQGFSVLVMGFTGKRARQFTYKYTLAFEQMAQQLNQPQIPQTLPEALRLAADLAEENEQLKPKAEMHDKFLAADNAQDMNTVAKALGTGRNKLFAKLRDERILRFNNTPYQEYLDRDYFRVIEKSIAMGGQTINKPQTLVTAKGMEFIARRIG